MPELAISFSTESVKHGPTRNPWDLERGVGGSSGGAAALVAAGAVPIAHGNDGAGSIRIPAACCGLVGLKPTRGRTPCGPDAGEPLFGVAADFALTRTVRDAAHLLDAIHGPGVGDKYSAPPPRGRYADELGVDPGPLRVAVTTRAWSGTAVDPEVAAAAAARRPRARGPRASSSARRARPSTGKRSCTPRIGELAAVAAPFLMAPRRPDPSKLEAVSRRVLDEAQRAERARPRGRVRRPEPRDAIGRRVLHRARPAGHADAGTAARAARHAGLRQPRAHDEELARALFDYGPFTAVFNISGQPAISLPLAQSASGLPIGVQLVAPYGREDLLFQIAAQLEQAMPWRHRTPGFHVGHPPT